MEREGDRMRIKSALSVLAGSAVLLAGCGSDKDKLERGIATEPEVAVPESVKELEMTEAERRAAEEAEEAAQEARGFEESQR
jgi:hypothetical protein